MASRSALATIATALMFAACATAPTSDDAPCEGEGCGDGGGGRDASSVDPPRPPFDADLTPDAETDALPGLDAGPQVRVMTFSIDHALESSIATIGAAIKAETPDVVGVQEVDVNTTRSGSSVDQAAELAAKTGLEKSFLKAIDFQGGQYGLAVLSRFPIKASTRVLLTSVGEQRILALFTLEVAPGKTITAAVSHLSPVGSESATQSTEIVNALAGKPRIVLLANLNQTPALAGVKTVTSALSDAWLAAGHTTGGETFPSTAPTERLDYVFLGKDWATPTGASVPIGTASNRRPVVASVPAF